jgi:transcriptional regulator with XRE-family HTH domain
LGKIYDLGMPMPKPSKKEVAERRHLSDQIRGVLSAARKKRGMSQDELAWASGVSKRNIQEILAGRVTNPRLWTLYKITRALGVPMKDVLKAFLKGR